MTGVGPSIVWEGEVGSSLAAGDTPWIQHLGRIIRKNERVVVYDCTYTTIYEDGMVSWK